VVKKAMYIGEADCASRRHTRISWDQIRGFETAVQVVRPLVPGPVKQARVDARIRNTMQTTLKIIVRKKPTYQYTLPPKNSDWFMSMYINRPMSTRICTKHEPITTFLAIFFRETSPNPRKINITGIRNTPQTVIKKTKGPRGIELIENIPHTNRRGSRSHAGKVIETSISRFNTINILPKKRAIVFGSIIILLIFI
jgi:hypothetical protein